MRTIYVIAGHNGPGTGAKGYLDEGKETIILREFIVGRLLDWGAKVKTDVDTDKLGAVVCWLKRLVSKKDIVIDLHFNASTTPSATGVECLISNEGELERDMAAELCNAVSQALGIRNRGVKGESSGAHSKLAMLSDFEAEQVLLEVCFVSNPKDAKAYIDNQELLATNIAHVLFKYAQS